MAYCTEADLTAVWGTAVDAWSDVDGTGASAARKAEAIDVATAEIDSVMRKSPFKIPLQASDGSVPLLVKHVCVALAGVWLYELRGVEADQTSGQPVHRLMHKRAWALQVLEDLRTQRRLVDLVKAQ